MTTTPNETLPTKAEVVADLLLAKALIEDPACWIKGKDYKVIDGRDCYCAEGALDKIARDRRGQSEEFSHDPIQRATYQALAAAASQLCDDRYSAGFSLNDAPLTTHRTVMEMFDNAIAAIERGQIEGVE